MIKLFFASIVFAFLINPAEAGKRDTDPTLKTRTVKISKKFHKIILNGDADIVFVKDNSTELTIKERTAIENTVKIQNEAGVMTIESADFYRGKKPLILIPVSELEFLELNGNVSVTTAALLQSKELRVFINGDCNIRIASSGKIFVDSSPDYHLKFKKQPTRFLPALKNQSK
ncbi:MAG: DUF2807 domain-containing protein [Rhizobacter sp.]|nr:DUF2807 domain-containing protein [Ferruginibacter sp.]